MQNFARKLASRTARRWVQVMAAVVLILGASALVWGEATTATAVAWAAVAVVTLAALKVSLVSLVATVQPQKRLVYEPASTGSSGLTDGPGLNVPRSNSPERSARKISGTSEYLRERASEMRWFHALDLGAFQTAGRFSPGVPPNCTLFPAMDLLKRLEINGSRCLDIGTAHGLMAFGMEEMGGDVTATDILDEPSPPFRLAHTALESSVAYAHNTPLRETVNEFGMNSFDVVVCAGVMYHILDPVDVVRIPRQLLRLNGYLVLETAFDSSAKAPSMTLNPVATPLVAEPRTYWLPSANGVLGLLQLFGFRAIGMRTISRPDRLAVLAQSVSASGAVDDVPEQVRRVWEVGFQDPLAAGESWNPEPKGTARVQGPARLDPFNQELDIHTYVPDFPPHPKEMVNVVGKER